ncbi:MAG TPA: amidohydrolase [Candidatus Limnocylindria bacterium]|jgi:cytosine/adenosine deaminase-related metal-dependent hydrolase|nr:amidohydrolase [Candidatus Limnocylindria bacterium]
MSSELCDLLIEGGTVITMDAERRVLSDGAIAIRGGRIVEVGRRADVVARYSAVRVIDGRRRVITPGLIQTHVHVSAEAAMRGTLPDTMPPSQWVRQVTAFYAAMSPDEEAVNATATFIELIRTGTTCFIEAGTTKHTDAVIDAMGRVGIRGCIGTWSWDIPRQPANLFQETDRAIEKNASLIERYDGAHDGRIRVWTSPIGHTMTSDGLLIGLKQLADRHRTGMTMHLSSWLEDVRSYVERTGMRPVKYYDHLGVLGPNVLLAHMVNLDDEEVELVLRSGTKIAHCPTTAGWFGYGLTQVGRFPEMLARGATIGLGCDAQTCSNNLDAVRAMYSSAILFRDARRDQNAMPAETVLEMATLHGARCALQEADLGSLEAGKKADVVLFDATRPEWRPLHHPIANLVFAADGHSVDTVLIDGRVVLEGGRMTSVDVEQTFRELERTGRRVLDATGWRTPAKWPVID